MPPALAPAALSFPQASPAPPACAEIAVDKIKIPPAAVSSFPCRPPPAAHCPSASLPCFLRAFGPSSPMAGYSEEGMIGTMEGVISQADARAGHGAGNPRGSKEISENYPSTSGKSIQIFQTCSQVYQVARPRLARQDKSGRRYHPLFGNGFRTGCHRPCQCRSIAHPCRLKGKQLFFTRGGTRATWA